MKNILLLTDFSENSINAAHYALQLFRTRACNFYVLHVQDSSTYTTDNLMLGGTKSIYETIVKKSKKKLAELVVTLETTYKREPYQYQIIVDFDSLIAAIKQVKKSKHIDLIVIGTNGVTGAREVVFGSNTIQVIRQVNCPTLVVPEAYTFTTPNHVLLPLDLSDSLSGRPFLELLKFTDTFSKTLHILRVKPKNKTCEAEEKDKEHIANFLKTFPYSYHVVSHVPMHYVVHCYAQSHDIELITLLVQKESFFERFFTSSPTTQISNTLSLPLLIFHS